MSQIYLPVVAKIFGSPGLKRTEKTKLLPHSKVLTGSDLYVQTLIRPDKNYKSPYTEDLRSLPIVIPYINLRTTSCCEKITFPLMVHSPKTIKNIKLILLPFEWKFKNMKTQDVYRLLENLRETITPNIGCNWLPSQKRNYPNMLGWGMISIKKLENMVALTLLSDESSSESMPLARGTLHSLTLIEKRRYTWYSNIYLEDYNTESKMLVRLLTCNQFHMTQVHVHL